jgi:hypothetical protein
MITQTQPIDPPQPRLTGLAAGNREQGVGTEREANPKQAARYGIEQGNEERHAGSTWPSSISAAGAGSSAPSAR